MDAGAKLALLQGYMAAILALRAAWARTHKRSRAPAAAEAVFSEVFLQRHHAKDASDLDRAALAELAGVTERQITNVLRWLHREGFVFQGRDASGRKLGTPMLVACWLVHRVFNTAHNSTPTGKSSSPSHYKDLPRCPSDSSEEDPYSDAGALDRARRANNGHDGTRSRAPWTRASVAWSALRQLGPPGGSG